MLGFIVRWLLSALALFLTARLVLGIHVSDATALFIAVLVLALLNAVLRPIVNMFTGCIQILTLGLLTLIINAAFFGLAASLVPGFEVRGFWAAFWGAIVMSILSFIFSMFVKLDDKKKDQDRD